MPRPRQVLPGQFYMVTRRCAQQMFLLRPDDVTSNAFLYCLALAAQFAGINVIATCAMSNHHHTVIYDPDGKFPKFIEYFHKQFARCQNVWRRRRENFWSSRRCNVIRLVDRDAIIDRLVYCLTNPVKDMLVDRVHHWPGVNSFLAMRKRAPAVATRPLHFFRDEGEELMPKTVSLSFEIPGVLGDANDVIEEISARVDAVERACAEERAKTGAGVVGKQRVLAESWSTCAASDEDHGELAPTIACRDRNTRMDALRELKAFFAAYLAARKDWLAGRHTRFPPGTYRMKEFDVRHAPS